MLQTREQFANSVVAAGLGSAQELHDFWNELPAEQLPADAKAASRLLVHHNRLTAFQANEILHERNTPLVLNDYVILDRLGHGGMGVVFKAKHRRLERLVALKLIAATRMMEVALKRFQREVKAAALLSHPNIVATHDAGEHRGHHYLVMEYVDGEDLDRVVERETLAPARAVNLILQAAAGLEYAHANGVIHRDIKPANLFLDKFNRLRILDMGIARIDLAHTSDDLTKTGQMMGTVDYMAPEQGNDIRNVDARCDIYSLGCTLYRLLTGRVMYEGDTVFEIAGRHATAPIPPLREHCPAATAELASIYQKMVAKKPKDRYPNMTAVRVALAEVEQRLLAAVVDAGGSTGSTWIRFMGGLWGKSKTRDQAPALAPHEPSHAAISVAPAVTADTHAESKRDGLAPVGTLAPEADLQPSASDTATDLGGTTPIQKQRPAPVRAAWADVPTATLRRTIGAVIACLAILAVGYAEWSNRQASVPYAANRQVEVPPAAVQQGAVPTVEAAKDYMVTVTAATAQITNDPAVLGTVERGTRLWVFEEKGNLLLVKVPGKEERGWISVQQAERIRLTDGQQQDVKLASAHWMRGWEFQNHQKREYAREAYLLSLALERRVFGPDHPKIAVALNNLGRLEDELGDYAAAYKYYDEALAIRRKVLGKEHPHTAATLHDLGILADNQGDEVAARKYYDEALAIYRKTPGNERPDTAMTLHNLAWLAADEGDPSAAADYLDKARRAVRSHEVRTLPALSETEQLAFVRNEHDNDWKNSLSLGRSERMTPQFAELSAAWLVNGKGITTATVAAEIQLGKPETTHLVAQLEEIFNELAVLMRNRQTGDLMAQLAAQQRLICLLEPPPVEDLAGDLWVEIETVRKAIPARAILVNFVRLLPYDYKTKQHGTALYVAWLIPAAGQDNVKIVDIGDADAIDAAVTAYQESMIGPAPQSDFEKLLTPVSDLVWKPLAEHLIGKEELILSPDAKLWLVPWGALPMKVGHTLNDHYSLQYVISGRELVAKKPNKPAE